MLKDIDVIATLGVKDVKAAGKFYEEKVGLERADGDSEVLTYKTGNSKLLVYESKFAGTNEATAATWVVHDIANVVGDLEKKGVLFENYDMPETTLVGNVHVSGRFKGAWFKDPDGNILALVEMGEAG